MKRYALDEFPYFSDENYLKNENSAAASCAPANSSIYDEASQHPVAMSRRSFMKMLGAAGFLAATGSVNLFPWRGTLVEAHADEQGVLSYVITVFKRWEIPVIVCDVSTDAKTPVPGATVQIHSFMTGKDSGELSTEDRGYCVIDARDYAETEEEDGTYSFTGSVKAWKDGWRVYETGLDCFHSGRRLYAATEPLDGRLYLQRLTFDDWDIQYADDPRFTRASNNDDDHTFLVKLAGADASGATVSLAQQGGRPIGTGTPVKADDGTYQVSFTGCYLCSDDGACLDAEDPVIVKVTQGGNELRVTTTMHVQQALFPDEVVDGTDEDFDILGLLISSLCNKGDETPALTDGSGTRSSRRRAYPS